MELDGRHVQRDHSTPQLRAGAALYVSESRRGERERPAGSEMGGDRGLAQQRGDRVDRRSIAHSLQIDGPKRSDGDAQHPGRRAATGDVRSAGWLPKIEPCWNAFRASKGQSPIVER